MENIQPTPEFIPFERLQQAASDWLTEKTKPSAADSQDLEHRSREIARVLDAVQHGREVFLLAEQKNWKGAHHYSLLYVSDKLKVERFWPGEYAAKALRYGKTRDSSPLPLYTLQSSAGNTSHADDASGYLVNVFNRMLEAAGSSVCMVHMFEPKFG